jgi:molecular chaperone DnaK
MSKIIGIDLGTSNSAAAYMEAGKPKMIPSAEGTTLVGGKAFPSYVAFSKEGELLVGEPARRQAVANPEGTITAAKRKMGTDFKYKIFDKEYSPQQISSFILQKIKKDSEMYLGDKVGKAVVTVPAYFSDAQRQATKDAGKIAGLDVIRLVNEPTAACLAYGLDKFKDKDQQVLVFDFGAGTLDVTIMNFGQGVFEVRSTSGDTQLGGRDMDEVLINYISEQFKKESGVDLKADKMATQRIQEAAEKAKIELSSVLETELNLPFITANAEGPKHLLMKLTRAKLEELVRPIVEKCQHSVEQAMNDAKLKPSDIEKIILVGGPTRMPMVQKFIENIFGSKIERGVDPMECVAMGAAIQGAILAGEKEVKDVLLLDVTPLTLGIETLGAVRTALIDRNTTIPTSKSQIFSTAMDSQPSVEIHVLQGERPMAADNRTLGRFILDGIPPAPRGIPQIEVVFDIDANGILTVTAKDKASGRSQNITIKDTSALSEQEIEKMKKEAEQFSAQDREKKELIDARNMADTLAYTTEKTVKDFGGKIKEEDKKVIEEKVEALKKVKDGNDINAIKKASEELSQAIQKVGSELYKAQQEAQKKDDKNPDIKEGETEEKK